ncbi:hypothetical protein AgCh_028282 [Apium graveolens]
MIGDEAPLRVIEDSTMMMCPEVDLVLYGFICFDSVELEVVRRSSWIHHEPGRNYGFLLTQDGDVMHTDNDKPLTYKDAMNSPDSESWLEDHYLVDVLLGWQDGKLPVDIKCVIRAKANKLKLEDERLFPSCKFSMFSIR